MKIIKELSTKDLDSLGLKYAYEIVKRKREIEELESKLDIIRAEVYRRINANKTSKLKITPFDLGKFGFKE